MTEVEIGREGSIWGAPRVIQSTSRFPDDRLRTRRGRVLSKVTGPIKNSCMDGSRPPTSE